MKVLAVLLLSLTVVLGMPQLVQDSAQSPAIPQEDNSPVLGGWVPVQGYVIVEDVLPGIQVEPVVKVEQDVKVEPVVKVERDVKVEPDVKVEGHVKVEPDVDGEPQVEKHIDQMLEDVKVEPDVDGEPQVEKHIDQMLEDIKVEPDVDGEPQVEKHIDQMLEDVKVEPDVDGEPQVEKHIDQMLEDVKVEPDVDGEPQVEKHIDQMLEDVKVEPDVDGEPQVEAEFEEDKSAMEGEYTPMEESVMELELEPLADVVMTEEQVIQVETEAVSATFGLDGEPLMELEPLLEERVGERETIMGEQPITELEPEEQAFMLDDVVEEHLAHSDMEKQRPFLGDDLAQIPEREPMMEIHPVLGGRSNVGMGPERQRRALVEVGGNELQQEPATRWTHCAGMVLEGKCYQFFKGPKQAADAEFFCQDTFPNGHLASVTSKNIHMQVMNMMLNENGAYTRTWVGGLRYLETGRFIWLDGSRWSYEDWLPGEPNHTANVEHCVELLAVGKGKFNDMPCWDLRAFICSFPY